MPDKIKLLFIGDIIGEAGFNLTKTLLPTYIAKHKLDFVIANGENITDGKGIVEKDPTHLIHFSSRSLYKKLSLYFDNVEVHPIASRFLFLSKNMFANYLLFKGKRKCF